MNEHRKKKIAPIVITVLLLLYYAVYFGVILSLLPPLWKVIVGVVPILIGGTMIYVCVQRLHEIDGGEEDDLSQY